METAEETARRAELAEHLSYCHNAVGQSSMFLASLLAETRQPFNILPNHVGRRVNGDER